MKNSLFLFTLTLNFLVYNYANAKENKWQNDIRAIVKASNADIGIAISGLDFKDSFIHNGERHYPMLSVYKFPLAVCILHKADKKELKISDKIVVPKELIDPDTWSPLAKKYPDQDIDMSIGELLVYSISLSDNNACDILFHKAGSTGHVNDYIHGLGVEGIEIAATEREMKTAWEVQYTNWCQPTAMLQLLRLFYSGKLLSKESNDYLMKLMVESSNSDKRIKGLLPQGAIVAHKTGTSNTNAQGINAATNDIAIITLPDGKHFGIVVYQSGSKADLEARELTIAKIAKAAWDHFIIDHHK